MPQFNMHNESVPARVRKHDLLECCCAGPFIPILFTVCDIFIMSSPGQSDCFRLTKGRKGCWGPVKVIPSHDILAFSKGGWDIHNFLTAFMSGLRNCIFSGSFSGIPWIICYFPYEIKISSYFDFFLQQLQEIHS